MGFVNSTANGVNGYHSYHIEQSSLHVASQVAELQMKLAQVQQENVELFRKLSAQNRPGKQLGGVIEAASIILSEHVSGGSTGTTSLQKKYVSLKRRKREWGVALLLMAGIVRSANQYGLVFNDGLTVQRAWQKLTATADTLSKTKDAIDQLRRYLPAYRRR